MAEVDIDDLIATTDGDTTWGDDMRGAMTTLKIGYRPGGVSGTRLETAIRHSICTGPFTTQSSSQTDAVKGSYVLGRSYVRGGTPTTVTIRVVTLAATSNMYWVVYNMDSDGCPTTLHASWGPFAITATGNIALTSQTQAVTAGFYLVGAFYPTGNTGAGAIMGFTPATMGPTSDFANPSRTTLVSSDSGHSTPQSLSAFTIGSYSATALATSPNGVPMMWGES